MTGFLCILVLQKHKVTNQASLPSLPAGPHMAMPLPWPAAPGMGAGPLHSPLCCIPPPPAWAERAFLKGASSAAPDSHSRAQSAQQPGVDRGAGFGWVSTGPPQSSPCPCKHLPSPLSALGAPAFPSCLCLPHSGPLWGVLEWSGQQPGWRTLPPPPLGGNRLARAHDDPVTTPPRRCSPGSR